MHIAWSRVEIAPNRWFEWDALWPVLPIEQLAQHPVRALLNLHMQPPLWNLLGLAMFTLFGDGFLEAIHVLHVLMGAAMTGMLVVLVAHLTGRPRVALGVGVLWALNPALVLYEAWGVYALATAFLVLAAVLLVVRFESSGRWRWLAAAFGVCNLLVLTRSLFHPLLLLPLAGCLVALAPARSRARAAVVALVLCLPVILWMGKNAQSFGVVGMSSWLGQNLWRVASASYSPVELAALAAQGVIAPVTAALPPFLPPSLYRRWGFDERVSAPELNEDHLNNINEIAISKTYGRSAWSLVRRDPLRTARTVARAVYFYTAPPARHVNLLANRKRLAWHDRVFTGWLLGDDWLRLPGDRGRSGALFALALVVGTTRAARRIAAEARSRGEDFVGWARRHPTVTLMAILAFYNMAVACLFEFGDNERFRFSVEALFWALFAWSLLGRRPALTADAPAGAGAAG